MYQHMSAEVGRTRQSDLRAAAAQRRLVAEAEGEQAGIAVRFRSAVSRLGRTRTGASVPMPTPAVRPAINPAG